VSAVSSSSPRPVEPSARWRKRSGPLGYLAGAVAVAAVLAFSELMVGYVQPSDLVMFNLVAVVAIAMRFDIGPSLWTAALSALGFDYFFLPPKFSFAPEDLKGAVTIVVMVVVAGIISGLGAQTRRQRAAAQAREVQIETERLRSSLLSVVSHDLRTPLAAILGAGTALLQDSARLDVAARDGLAESIVEEAERLAQLVTNLLDMVRLDDGAVEVRKRPEALDEVVESALERLRGRLGDRPLQSRVPQEIPMVPMDAVLIRQVLVNVLENALRYAPERSPIELEAMAIPGSVRVEVRDRGPGILDGEAERLFDRFYRGSVSAARDGGVGLGLTICRAIVDAHGGSIRIENRAGGGAVVRVELPLEQESRVQ
jgi:K+-sensing histidine kinase KdpD